MNRGLSPWVERGGDLEVDEEVFADGQRRRSSGRPGCPSPVTPRAVNRYAESAVGALKVTRALPSLPVTTRGVPVGRLDESLAAAGHAEQCRSRRARRRAASHAPSDCPEPDVAVCAALLGFGDPSSSLRSANRCPRKARFASSLGLARTVDAVFDACAGRLRGPPLPCHSAHAPPPMPPIMRSIGGGSAGTTGKQPHPAAIVSGCRRAFGAIACDLHLAPGLFTTSSRRPRWPSRRPPRSASSTTACGHRGRRRRIVKRVRRLGREGSGAGLVVEERADRRQLVAVEPQERAVDQGERELGRDGPAELVDGRDLDLDVVARPDRSASSARPSPAGRARPGCRAAPGRTAFSAIRAAVSVKLGNCAPSIAQADRVVAFAQSRRAGR